MVQVWVVVLVDATFRHLFRFLAFSDKVVVSAFFDASVVTVSLLTVFSISSVD